MKFIAIIIAITYISPATAGDLYAVLSASHDSQLQTRYDYGINAAGPGLRYESRHFYIQGNVYYQFRHPPCVYKDLTPAAYCKWDRNEYLPWIGHVEFGYRVHLWGSTK